MNTTSVHGPSPVAGERNISTKKNAKNIAGNAGGPRGKDGACPEIGETAPGRGAAANALADFSL